VQVNKDHRPFTGLRVLDLTHVLAGPFCTYLLALLGADTIKIEPPGEPDEVRGRGVDPALNAMLMGTNYLTQGANKRALTLNLKSEKGRRILKELAATADIFVENYRAGALSEAGLGYDEIRKVNPQIIYCSMTGFGQEGPRAAVNAYDNVIQAASGLMSVTGTPEVHPLKAGAAIVDYACGLNAAFAIASAVARRERTGKGVYIDCSMLDTALFLMASQVTAVCRDAGFAPKPAGNDQKEAGLCCYDTADGLLMLGAFNRRQHERLWTAFERPDFAVKSSWEQMAEHAPAMRAELARRLKEKPAAEWETFLHERGIPAERVRSIREAIDIADAPEHRLTGLLDPLDNGAQIRVPAMPFQFSADGPQITRRPPRMGEHNDEILAELGYPSDEIEKLHDGGVI
jgi:crotonobetainyl-CoA:carnitine CoA-transferase CaiB-like acyl-CoA transferase